jgi:transketolase
MGTQRGDIAPSAKTIVHPKQRNTMSYEDLLIQLALSDSRIVVLTAENRVAIKHLPQILGERFIDVGICEQTLIGTAAGLALRGRIPVVHALAAFLVMRALEFIRTDVALPALPVKMVGYVPGLLSEGNGPTHQAVEDIALLRALPRLQIFCPADEEELLMALPVIIESPEPCYIRYNESPPAVEHRSDFRLGCAEILREGRDIAILTYGILLGQAYRAALLLEQQGLSVRLVNLRMLCPLDEGTMVQAVKETRMVVTLEDHINTGGLASILADIIMRRCLRTQVLPVALAHHGFIAAPFGRLLAYEGFAADQLAKKIFSAFEQKNLSPLSPMAIDPGDFSFNQ